MDDRDLAALSGRLVDGRGGPAEAELVAELVASRPGSEPELRLDHGGARVRVGRIDSGEVAERLGFDPRPSSSARATPRAGC